MFPREAFRALARAPSDPLVHQEATAAFIQWIVAATNITDLLGDGEEAARVSTFLYAQPRLHILAEPDPLLRLHPSELRTLQSAPRDVLQRCAGRRSKPGYMMECTIEYRPDPALDDFLFRVDVWERAWAHTS